MNKRASLLSVLFFFSCELVYANPSSEVNLEAPSSGEKNLVIERAKREYFEKGESLPWFAKFIHQLTATKKYESFKNNLDNNDKSVVVCCSIAQSGAVSHAYVWQSSNSKSVDKKALELVYMSSPLDPPPNDLPCMNDVALIFTPGLLPQAMLANDAKSALIQIRNSQLSEKGAR